jgi:glycosyltransferase involved in cell wall biosynthesis
MDKAVQVRIGIFVHGRFHAFDFARALQRAGADVTVFTNYPPWAVRRFGLDPRVVRSFWVHGLVSRAASSIEPYIHFDWQESWTHRMFARWAARQLKHRDYDVVHLWSGIAEESLMFLRRHKPHQLAIVVRGSAHILRQRELLLEEQRRAGVPMGVPSDWIVAREEREYNLASAVCTISSFAYETFRAAGVPEERLVMIPLGVDVRAFRPSQREIEARVERILSGRPLRVLTVGTLSFRKGALDYQRVVQSAPDLFHFRFVGTVNNECRDLAAGIGDSVEFIGRRPQSELPTHYHWGDIFFFPTIEDGFAAVLAQAHAAGLPIVTTQNSSGPDLIEHGKTGWIVPARDSAAMSRYLLWCHQNRARVAEICQMITKQQHIRSWDDMARDYLAAIVGRLALGLGQPGHPQSSEFSFHAS